ncbi:MAG: type II secretion system F family protein [Alphaproteobacteria bacterium]
MEVLLNNPEIVFGLCAFALVPTAFLMAYGSSDDRKIRKRIEKVALLEAPDAMLTRQKNKSTPANIRAKKKGAAKFLPQESRFSILAPDLNIVRLRLERAGFDWGPGTLAGIIAGIAIIVAVGVLMFSSLPLTAAAAVGLLVGVALPTIVIRSRGARRAKAFLTDLPDAIELIVRSVKSGLPVSESIHAIARDLKGPAAVEFKKISDEMMIGIDMEEGLNRSVQRLGLTDYAFLAVSLSITRETGGNLSESLGNLARLLRSRQQMHLKIRAYSSEARASAMIIGALPFVVMGILLVLNPDYMGVLFSDPSGQEVLAFAGTSMAIGFGVMIKMVRFDF